MRRIAFLVPLLFAGAALVAADPAPRAPAPPATSVGLGAAPAAQPGVTFVGLGGLQPVHPKAADPAPAKAFPRGRKAAPPEVTKKRHEDAFKRHGHRVSVMAEVTAASFDCRAMGWVLPVNDQGNCGDCFGISTLDGIACARVKAGVAKADESGRLSGQYGLDDRSAFQGGCDGGDEAQVFEFAKVTGFPLTSDYGAYTASPGRLKPVDPSKRVKIIDWGYCKGDQGGGIASADDIKKCMAQYGPISVAFDASECDSYRWPNTMRGKGRSVDHAVLCVGWDDAHDNGDGTKGAFLGYNQWGKGWGGPGVFWIKYGSDSWGTEAIWCTVAALPPPPPPPPGPPVPPVPPTPPIPPAPVPGDGFTGTVTQTWVGGRLIKTVESPSGTGIETLDDAIAAALADPKVAAALKAKGVEAGGVIPAALLIKIMAAVIPVVIADLAAHKTFAQMVPDLIQAILGALVTADPAPEVPMPMPEKKPAP